MCLPQCVVVPPMPHRDISIWKPPPFTSNWNVSKSTCVTCTRLRCGYEPVKPLSRSTGSTEVFKATSISSRGDSIACLTMRLSDARLRQRDQVYDSVRFGPQQNYGDVEFRQMLLER